MNRHILAAMSAEQVAFEVPEVAIDVDTWLTLAADRPEWMLWGKAQPEQDVIAHPLLCHCLDVAAVAGLFLTELLPKAVRGRLLGLHADPEQALRFLLFLVALHDFGKATPAFQMLADWARLALDARGFDFHVKKRDARHHSDTGMYFLAAELTERGADGPVAADLARSVTAHHGLFPADELLDPHSMGPVEKGRNPIWEVSRRGLVDALARFFRVPPLSEVDSPKRGDVMVLAGLASVADWIGSMQEVFVYEPPSPSVDSYWPRAVERAGRAVTRAGFRAQGDSSPKRFVDLFPHYAPWPLHEQADVLAADMEEPSLVVIEAPMGEGKTEAAMLFANAAASRLGQSGLFIGLPTRATANQMFNRTLRFLERTRADALTTLLLAHGEASLVDAFEELRLSDIHDEKADGRAGRASGAVRAEAWFSSRKRALLGEHAVGTVDQALLATMLVPHNFVRHFGLAGKTVVLDEVHAYDTYTGRLLDRLVGWLGAAGTTVVLLSATLPSTRRDQLLQAYVRGARTRNGLARNALPVRQPNAADAPYPRITVANAHRRSATTVGQRRVPTTIQIARLADDIPRVAEAIVAELASGGCIGWICNTVDRAQRAYADLRRRAPDIPAILLHSRLFPSERLGREQLLERWLGPQGEKRERPGRCVVVGTQVLEQSLDVDFDLLVTDIAPIDLVFQRAGRLFRHDRENRATSRTSPHLWLVLPDGSPTEANLDSIAIAYDAYPVRRTLEVLEGRSTIELPTVMEELIERVYDGTILPPDHPLSGAQIEQRGRAAAQAGDAEQRLLPQPDYPDEPFGELNQFFDEDEDPAVHALLRAKTRDGRPSVTIVCLERRGAGLFASSAADLQQMQVDLVQAPPKAVIRQLVQRSISLSRPAVVRALVQDSDAAPEGWQRSALLRNRRVVVFEDGRAEVGGVELTLDPDLGLVMSSTDPREGGGA